MFSGMTIPTAEEETGVLNARVGLLSWLDAGVGYAFETEKVLWDARVQPVLEQEDGWKPGLILGTGSVQTGGSDQSVYAQVIKSWEVSETFGLRFSTGVATLLPDHDQLFGMAGLTASLSERYALFGNYDGESFHEGLAWIPLDWLTVSFLMIETEFPAISITVKR
ncbi:MAG: hypothetical protein OEV49_11605 [candidate division Zixibacteria bacterium]|nr:hypothetical protein [candidate division Zixibacteria bacterium]MDH3938276.1 hypothetical protein [candidate division Zixibacteria bacterium]MDH4034417.1 hypothetical protein [candidate division Zixibacteria bacterium]